MILPLALVLMAAGAAASQPCDEGEVRLTADFPGARAADCRRTAEGFEVTVRPETTPINNSPWYAFDLEAQEPAEVSVRLQYEDGRHRYWPKRQGGAGWTRLPGDAVAVSQDRSTATFSLPVGSGTTRIAAQPLETSEERARWLRQLADETGYEAVEIGSSVQGAPLTAYVAGPAGAPLILLLGSQHPPEVPGWTAMRAFLQRLWADEELRRTYRIVAVPLLNPDGVDAGNWRANARGKDLNRDWGVFGEQETRAVRTLLESEAGKGSEPVLLLDFHATFKGDLLYTPEAGRACRGRGFAPQFEEALAGEDEFVANASYNPGYPSAKSWFLDRYSAPGITVELGDRTDPEHASVLGRRVAEVLLEAPPDPENRCDRSR